MSFEIGVSIHYFGHKVCICPLDCDLECFDLDRWNHIWCIFPVLPVNVLWFTCKCYSAEYLCANCDNIHRHLNQRVQLFGKDEHNFGAHSIKLLLLKNPPPQQIWFRCYWIIDTCILTSSYKCKSHNTNKYKQEAHGP